MALSTAFNLALALYHLDTRSLWLDEGYTWSIASLNSADVVRTANQQGGHLVFYYLLVHLLISWFGDGVSVMRMPSVVAGAASVPLVFLLTCRLAADRLAGIFATVLFAVSMPLVFWQQNARDYAIVVLLGVASTLLLVVAVQTRRRAAFAGWGAVSALACYTHTEVVLLVAAQVIPLLLWPLGRALWRPLAVVLGILTIAAIWPVVEAIKHASLQTAFLLPPNGAAAREVATFLASGAGTAATVGPTDYALLALTAFLWAAALFGLVADVARRGPTEDNFGRAVALSWLLAPPLFAWAISEIDRPVFLDRYLIVSLPAAAIVIAMVLVRVRPRAVGFFGLIYLTVFRFGVLVPSYNKPLDNFAGATRVVLAHARSSDCIAFYQNSARTLYDYYSVHLTVSRSHHRAPLPRQIMPPAPSGDNPATVDYYANASPGEIALYQTPAAIAATASFCPRLWLLESHAGSPTGPSHQRASYDYLVALRQKLLANYTPPTNYDLGGVGLQLYRRNPTPPGSAPPQIPAPAPAAS